MPNNACSPMSRRGLLGLGLLAAAFGVAGCGEPGIHQVTTPPSEGGNRSRLKKLEQTTEDLKAKSQKK